MPAAFIYLLKLSVSLGVVFLFYQLVLRRLTFYNWNRWYLLGYALLSFFIPFIDITNAIKKDQLTTNSILQWIPVLYTNKASDLVTHESGFTVWGIISIFIAAGVLIMLVRLLVQLFSFRKMMRNAELISNEDINIYQVNESIIPFSFGNAVFINKKLHTQEELEEIIRHEFVHVKQRHSVDIILSEILCLLNWYNPFAWMLRSAIRQNLEFVADNKVLQNGINKKQYQYMLLKVIGNDQFSIAQKFNFSSLKKRIAMMNKNKSTKMHLLRFLFLLPVLALILVSFRKEIGDTLTGKNKQFSSQQRNASDTIPAVMEPNDKGYIINVTDRSGNCTLVIKDKSGKEVKRMLLTEWNADTEKYEALYGAIPSPPPPLTPPAPPTPSLSVDVLAPPLPPVPPAAVVETKLPENVQRINVENGKATIWLKNGQKENYDLKDKVQKEKFEKKYGEIIPPAPPIPVASSADNGYSTVSDEFRTVSDEYEITDKKAVLHLRNGKTEKYDLTNKEERAAFEKKYGKIINTTMHTNINTNFDMTTDVTTTVAPAIKAVVTSDVKASVSSDVRAVVAPVPGSINVITGNVTMNDKYGYQITGDEAIVLTITQKTTKAELENFKRQMKDKGVELIYEEVEYNDKGILVAIRGTMKSNGSKNNFSASGFRKLVLAMIKKGEKAVLKVNVVEEEII